MDSLVTENWMVCSLNTNSFAHHLIFMNVIIWVMLTLKYTYDYCKSKSSDNWCTHLPLRRVIICERRYVINVVSYLFSISLKARLTLRDVHEIISRVRQHVELGNSNPSQYHLTSSLCPFMLPPERIPDIVSVGNINFWLYQYLLFYCLYHCLISFCCSTSVLY